MNIPYDPKQYPLWRINVQKLDNDRIYFFASCIHVVWDGWSYASFIVELAKTYYELGKNPNYQLQNLKNKPMKEKILRYLKDNMGYEEK